VVDPDIRLGANVICFQYLKFISSLEGSEYISKLDGAMARFAPGSSTVDVDMWIFCSVP